MFVNVGKARHMFQMQAKMNSRINRPWISVKTDFLEMAADCCKKLNSGICKTNNSFLGFKNDSTSWNNLMELWHCLVSHILSSSKGDVNSAVGILIESLTNDGQSIPCDGDLHGIYTLGTKDKSHLLERLLKKGEFEMCVFESILDDTGKSWDDIYAWHVGRYILQIFRNEKKELDGIYHDKWAGRTDNEYLSEILNGVDLGDTELAKLTIYSKLGEKYSDVRECIT